MDLFIPRVNLLFRCSSQIINEHERDAVAREFVISAATTVF